ncbi:ThuA domain-containing protein [Paenibacillus pinisoli]|uniref:ThuA domain-containing protein n=1 Tax=Paenibacillus pinisoli TaxID=1276110 RepID=A0A3A6PII9_9BACL|nr:ThuA domain-containing protein [Paenibacillus pinisoli]RJX38079.1 ThuA domain-containing protein [Paenibacillus pinisoli]
MTTLTKLLLIGDNVRSAWHPLEPARQQLEEIAADEFELVSTEDYEALTTLDQDGYSAVISYADCFDRKLAPEQIGRLLRFVAGGGGLLVIHNGISLGRTSHELAGLIGARFTGHPPYQPLTYHPMQVDHPLLEGVQAFTVDEEPYMFEFDALSPRNLLLEYEFEGSRYPAGWEHRYGLGRLVYLQPGHCAPSFLPDSYRQLIRNSMRWAAARNPLP